MPKLFKSVLIAFGLLFLVSLVGISVLIHAHQNFKRLYAPTVEGFFRDYSKAWQLSDVKLRISSNLQHKLQAVSTQPKRNYLQGLGELQSINQPELARYDTTLLEQVGVFQFTSWFEHAITHVEVTVRQQANQVVIEEFKIMPIEQHLAHDKLSA